METTVNAPLGAVRETALQRAVYAVFNSEEHKTEARKTLEYRGTEKGEFVHRLDIHDDPHTVLHYARRVVIDDPSRMEDTVNARQQQGKFIEHFVVQVGDESVVAERVKGTDMYEVLCIYRDSPAEFKKCKTEKEISDVLKTIREAA